MGGWKYIRRSDYNISRGENPKKLGSSLLVVRTELDKTLSYVGLGMNTRVSCTPVDVKITFNANMTPAEE